MKRVCAIAFLGVALGCLGQISVPPGVWPDPDFDKYRSFVVKLDRFNRKLGGCQLSGLDMSACKPDLGSYDVALWRELRKDAQEVFQMKQ